MRLLSPYAPNDPRSLHHLQSWHACNMILSEHVYTLLPAVKSKLCVQLGQPNVLMQIPIKRTIQFPAKSLNVSVSTNSGNATAIEKFLDQGGADRSKFSEYVLIVHGDLGTGEKILNLQRSRSIEKNEFNRLQFIIYTPGLFHIKMAAADAIWRMYLDSYKPGTQGDIPKGSILHLCALIRPKELSKLTSKPGFRMTHDLINHVLLATMSEAWWTEVLIQFCVSLEEWNPTMSQLQLVASAVIDKYVASTDFVPAPQSQSQSHNDDMLNNMLKLFNRDAMLYVMLSDSINRGDIARVEQLLLYWVHIWQAAGKHKYATHLSRFLLRLNYEWSPQLARAVRLNWLVNPKGKALGFRPVDWLIERNNLLHKQVHSGSSSNHTIEMIEKRSTLITLYGEMHVVMEKSFYLAQKTVYHPPPAMAKTIRKLQDYIQEQGLYTPQPSRLLAFAPRNYLQEGLHEATSLRFAKLLLAETEPLGGNELPNAIDEALEVAPTAEDVGVDEI